MSPYDEAVKKLEQEREERAKKGRPPWQLFDPKDDDWDVHPDLVEGLAKPTQDTESDSD